MRKPFYNLREKMKAEKRSWGKRKSCQKKRKEERRRSLKRNSFSFWNPIVRRVKVTRDENG